MKEIFQDFFDKASNRKAGARHSDAQADDEVDSSGLVEDSLTQSLPNIRTRASAELNSSGFTRSEFENKRALSGACPFAQWVLDANSLPQPPVAFGVGLPTQVGARIGGLVWQQRSTGTNHCLHIQRPGRTVAIVDVGKQSVAMRRDLSKDDLVGLHATSMPRAASYAPADFAHLGVWDALWLFGTHCREALLEVPAQYGEDHIVLRRLPRVAPHFLASSSLQVCAALLRGPYTFDELLELGLEELPLLASTVTALYLSRSVITQRPGV